ncbi:recombinase RecX [Marinobacter fuscus]|uniref:Regulatory protein RecX n=1 Tax=Marinobacter fuscus TaxID=2109942 RepID=A0A2T1KWC2_9GAMM|nr:regulatory protein RecX [Marinobacter fuscus]PSF14395.1 recombinase RecX [Marinobacter fuscus]
MAKESKQDDPDYRARSTALRLLARREHSRSELALKLRQRDIPSATIDSVLDDYEQEGWLSDERFADVFARQKMDQGYGPLKIEADLQQKGVCRMPECLQSIPEEVWVERAAEARIKRFGKVLPRNLSEKARQFRFLARRGFTSAQANGAFCLQD